MFKAIINKLFCCHKWEVFSNTEIYANSKLPTRVIIILICSKCGKLKKIEIK